MKHFFSILILLFPVFSFAQLGYSSASMSMSQQNHNRYRIPAADEIVVEEYMNFHRHNLPLPSGNASICVSTEWGSSNIRPGSEAILQVGLTTLQMTDMSDAAPLNVSLVIDKSGSMSGEKMEKTKDALKAFADKLRPKDILSIIAFDHTIETILSARQVKNPSIIKQAIEGIYPGGSTNMNDGIITGYKEVQKNYNQRYTNRIIILTDAITNTGVVDPEEIIRSSHQNNLEDGIDFVLIGVGTDFNYQLSRQMTQSERTALHFINDASDIQKVFIDEAESLLAPIAKEAELEIAFDSKLQLEEVYGYQPRFEGNKIKLKLKRMNAGLTQVVLIKFRVPANYDRGSFDATATVRYYDITRKRNQTISDTKSVSLSPYASEHINNRDIEKNYWIAHMAQTLKTMAEKHHKGHPQQALDEVQIAIGDVKRRFPSPRDEDVQRMLDILQNYSGMISSR